MARMLILRVKRKPTNLHEFVGAIYCAPTAKSNGITGLCRTRGFYRRRRYYGEELAGLRGNQDGIQL